MTPEQSLWTSVLELAFYDALQPKEPVFDVDRIEGEDEDEYKKRYLAKNRKALRHNGEIEAAIDFFDTEHYKNICNSLELDHAYFKDKLYQKLMGAR